MLVGLLAADCPIWWNPGRGTPDIQEWIRHKLQFRRGRDSRVRGGNAYPDTAVPDGGEPRRSGRGAGWTVHVLGRAASHESPAVRIRRGAVLGHPLASASPAGADAGDFSVQHHCWRNFPAGIRGQAAIVDGLEPGGMVAKACSKCAAVCTRGMSQKRPPLLSLCLSTICSTSQFGTRDALRSVGSCAPVMDFTA